MHKVDVDSLLQGKQSKYALVVGVAKRAREITQTFEEEQMIRFYVGRLFTLGVEESILALFVTALHMNSIVVKVVAQVIVIVLNYIISKLLIFTRKN